MEQYNDQLQVTTEIESVNQWVQNTAAFQIKTWTYCKKELLFFKFCLGRLEEKLFSFDVRLYQVFQLEEGQEII